ncbi:MAG: mechanosensitive ion channel [Methanobacteriota archaeon]|nr:MAG: mechanosensitive ion channel [Euryarchaeota archaeon]TLZ92276.1 MAG: mechanosensitive ion channel [Euryarchaeota archaeon]
MRSANWRKARALFWLTLTIVVIVTLLLLGGVFQVAGLPAGDASYLHQFSPWIIVVPILIATKALLELLRPVFRAALRSHVKYEADIFAHFQIVSYVVWATALALVLFVTLGSGASQFGAIGTGVFLGAFVFVMQEPLLNIVGWMVVTVMGLYKLGDRVELNNTRGYIVEITPMNTTLREFGGVLYGDSFTGRYVTVPNSFVIKSNVFNYTKDTPFVWDQIVINVTYESDMKLAERLILEVAEETVGPMMRENRAHLRSKYEFADLADYMAEEPKVGWAFGASSIELTLLYFCPVFAKGSYRTRLVKRIYEKIMAEPRVQFAYPHVQFVPQEPGEKEKEAARAKEKLPILR